MNTFSTDLAINAANGASGTHTKTYKVEQSNGMCFHLVTTSTLDTTSSGGWTIEGSNAPEEGSYSSIQPNTDTFDWVDLGLTITNPTGSATNQLVIVDNVRCRWVRVSWTAAGSGAGNVSAMVCKSGNG